MKELKDYSVNELVAELSSRRNEQARPKLNRDINWGPVVEYVAWVCETTRSPPRSHLKSLPTG
jgi:hypothetical protein